MSATKTKPLTLLGPDPDGWSLWMWSAGTNVSTPYIAMRYAPDRDDHSNLMRSWTKIAEGGEEYILALKNLLTTEAINEHRGS